MKGFALRSRIRETREACAVHDGGGERAVRSTNTMPPSTDLFQEETRREVGCVTIPSGCNQRCSPPSSSRHLYPSPPRPSSLAPTPASRLGPAAAATAGRPTTFAPHPRAVAANRGTKHAGHGETVTTEHEGGGSKIKSQCMFIMHALLVKTKTRSNVTHAF